MAVFTETIKLDDQVSPAAKRMASAFDDLNKGLESARTNMVKSQALGDKLGFDKAAADSKRFESALGNLDQGLVQQGKSAEFAAQGTEALATDLAATVGVLAAVAAAIGAVVIGFGAIVLAGAKFAISSSEAKNASIALFEAMGQGKISGEQVDDMLDELRATTGLTKDSLSGLTTTFLRMGITGEDALKGLTIAAASAESLAKGGGEAFAQMYEKTQAAASSGEKLVIPFKKLTTQLAGVGLNAGDVAKSMGIAESALVSGLEKGTIGAKEFGNALQDAATKKGAGPLKNLANSSANLGKLLQEYLGDLFEDLGKDIAPFMAQVRSLFEILDQGKPSGQALKAGIGGFFKEVFADAAKVVPMVKHFLLDVIIYGLKAYIALKPIVQTIRDFANSAEGVNTIKTLGTAFETIGLAALFVGAILIGLAGILVVMSAAFGSALGAILQFGADASNALGAFILSAPKAASDFITGLVTGITDGAALVTKTVSGLATSALNAFTGGDGIDAHSPSRKMMRAGGHMTDGVVEGIDNGAPDVHGASSGLAQGAVKSASPDGSDATGGAPASSGANINVVVTIDGAGKSAMEITQEMVSSVFQRMALEAGV